MEDSLGNSLELYAQISGHTAGNDNDPLCRQIELIHGIHKTHAKPCKCEQCSQRHHIPEPPDCRKRPDDKLPDRHYRLITDHSQCDQRNHICYQNRNDNAEYSKK